MMIQLDLEHIYIPILLMLNPLLFLKETNYGATIEIRRWKRIFWLMVCRRWCADSWLYNHLRIQMLLTTAKYGISCLCIWTH